MGEFEIVLVMGSIHRVLKAEKVLRAEGLPVDTRITPREVSSDCGMVVTVGQVDAARALELLARAEVAPLEVWRMESGTCRQLEGARRP